MPRYDWIDGPPRYWNFWIGLFWAATAEFAVGWMMGITISEWGQSFPDAGHTVQLRMNGGPTYYLSRHLGWYMNNFMWIFFGLSGILVFFVLIHGNKLRRVR